MKRRVGVCAVAGVLACGEGSSEADGDSGAGDVGVPADAALADEFDGDLGAWAVLNPETAALSVSGGSLHIEPGAQTLWFDDSAAVLVHQHIRGDFVATAFVRARGLADPTAAPVPQYRLGGLMARADRDAQDYVFIALGADDADVSVETKSTVDSTSTYAGPPWPSGEGELRICRVGARFRLLVRDSSAGAWVEQASYDRADLPETLQVGVMAYANASPADLRLDVDYVRWALPAGAGACVQ